MKSNATNWDQRPELSTIGLKTAFFVILVLHKGLMHP